MKTTCYSLLDKCINVERSQEQLEPFTWVDWVIGTLTVIGSFTVACALVYL